MNTSIRLCLRPKPLLLSVLLAALPLLPVSAFDPTISKLYARNTTVQTGPNFGYAVAVNEKWIVVGEPFHNEPGLSGAGAVHVFNAVTRAYVRTLTAKSSATVSDAHADDLFGWSVAVSGDLAVIGALTGDGLVPDSGCAYVFNLATGAWVANLAAADGEAAEEFGSSVAVSGTLALVGATRGDQDAPAQAGCGAAYLFNALTGVQLSKLTSGTTALPNDFFGCSVALSGRLALVGAYQADGSVGNEGIACLFDATAGTASLLPFAILEANPGTANSFFGFSVAMNGDLALVGAPQGNGAVAESGAAYVFRLGNISTAYPLQGSGGAFSRFGTSTALSGELAMVGEVNAGTGSGFVYLLNARTLDEIKRISPPDGQFNRHFGASVALCGATAVVGCPEDADLGAAAGAAYVFQPLARPLPMIKAAALKDFGLGAPNTSYLSFGDAFCNDFGEVIYTGTLAGTGAAGGKNLGLWSNMEQPNLVQRSGLDVDPIPGVRATALLRPIMNRLDFAIFTANLAGNGVGMGNNRAILGYDDNAVVNKILRLGEEPMGLGLVVSNFLQTVQPRVADQVSVAVQLKLSTSPLSVTPASDSALLVLTNTGTYVSALREGSEPNFQVLLGDNAVYGQFSRLSHQNTELVCAVPLQSAAATNQVVFRFDPGVSETLLARKGETVPLDANGDPLGTGVFFSAFLGETTSGDNKAVFRATLTGPGVTAANNEGLWSEHTGPLRMVARKGDLVAPAGDPAGFSNIKWATFPNFWGIGVSTGQVLFRARLQGPGVTTLNDESLWLKQENGSLLVLLREGDPAPDCATARIGAFQSVVADPNSGEYLVLTSLRNSSPATNQALFTGTTGVNIARAPLRRAFMQLRKGTLYQSPLGSTTTLRSLSLPASAFDATGAGAKGLGQPLGFFGEMVLRAIFNNNSVELIRGVP